jgi:hypothetical protein
LKHTILGVALAFGVASGIITGAVLVKRIAVPNIRKWFMRMESKQIDNEIRLDLLEYNHLHETDNLRLF